MLSSAAALPQVRTVSLEFLRDCASFTTFTSRPESIVCLHVFATAMVPIYVVRISTRFMSCGVFGGIFPKCQLREVYFVNDILQSCNIIKNNSSICYGVGRRLIRHTGHHLI